MTTTPIRQREVHFVFYSEQTGKNMREYAADEISIYFFGFSRLSKSSRIVFINEFSPCFCLICMEINPEEYEKNAATSNVSTENGEQTLVGHANLA